MPVHEWTRVTAGTFHDFHNAWITELRNGLNSGLLPEGYYALGEQRSGDVSPDVLTRHAETAPPGWTSETASDDTGMIAVAEQPPKVTLTLEAATDAAFYIAKRRTLKFSLRLTSWMVRPLLSYRIFTSVGRDTGGPAELLPGSAPGNERAVRPLSDRMPAREAGTGAVDSIRQLLLCASDRQRV